MIKLTKKQLLIMVGIGAMIIFVIGYYIYSISTEESYEQIDTITQEVETKITKAEQETEEIVIHIAGEVKNPGIVKIKEGARIADVIEKAGGLTKEANITNINLAYIIEDGQKITIPSNLEEIKENITKESGQGVSENISQTNTSTNTKININKAEKDELQNLQGIGEATAQKIIEYRKQNGEFKQIEDIKNVPGIGDSKFEAIKENIKVK